MGIFSFLTSKEPAVTSASPTATAEPTPQPSGTSRPLNPAPEVPDTPFVPPAVWDTGGVDLDVGALTAPLPTVSGDQPTVGPPDPTLTAEFQSQIIEVIKTVFDPEIPVDIYELGL